MTQKALEYWGAELHQMRKVLVICTQSKGEDILRGWVQLLESVAQLVLFRLRQNCVKKNLALFSLFEMINSALVFKMYLSN